jgi:TetR/AcrR family transcriptional regulator, transcriptional repressor for nem operon
MRYSRSRKSETHARIVNSASRQLRAAGVNGVGVADLMRGAGLTHGGFYSHFESKEALVAESISAAMKQTIGRLRASAEAAPLGKGKMAIAKAYLTTAHLDRIETGCAVAALGSDIARMSPATRLVFEARLEEMIMMLDEFASGCGDTRRQSITMLATMIGALVMARAVKSKALSEEIRAAARDTVA